MTFVPADAAQVLPAETPRAGGTAKVLAAARYANETAQCALHYQLAVRRAHSGLMASHSRALATLEERLSSHLSLASQALERAALRAKSALDAYASEVERINWSADRVTQDVNESLGIIRSSAGVIDDISLALQHYGVYSWRMFPTTNLPDSAMGAWDGGAGMGESADLQASMRSGYEQQWVAAVTAWREAVDAIDARVGTWNQLVSERKDAETRLTLELDASEIVQTLIPVQQEALR